MRAEDIDRELKAEFQAAAEELGCELLAVETKGGTLRLILDHPDGVTLEHCESVSKQASALLDVADVKSGKYVLEVSSPGLDRKFYRMDDYQRFLGRTVRVTWRHPEDRSKETVVGKLLSFTAEKPQSIGLEIEGSTRNVDIRLQDVESTRLEPEYGS
jgi:ribosome maturation factor RimP